MRTYGAFSFAMKRGESPRKDVVIMSKTIIPKDYQPSIGLGLSETQAAISKIKNCFANQLRGALCLARVSAPLFVDPSTGLNDDLNGVERAVSFDIKETGTTAQVVHSLAKWKRMALHEYEFQPHTGLYTDMNAIRRDESLDNLHSIYVDQWDWETVIHPEDRTVVYLKNTVNRIVDAIWRTLECIKTEYPQIHVSLSKNVSFVTTQELEDQYPSLSPKERENEYLKEHKTAFVMQIGDTLHSGQRHDGRAPDYDDWSLNGDIIFWNEVLGCAFEVSSMGIRVDAKALAAQLKKAGCEDRARLPFHQMVANGVLPLTMGGGIGQSRLCMLLLGKAHIGEVQASIWDSDTREICQSAGIRLL